MADPNPSIYNAADDTEITAINYGTGDAGDYKPSSAGTEYHIWNDKGKVLTSSPMTSIKVTVRDSDGQWVENITVQKWVEVKSTTIHAGADGGSISGYSDDFDIIRWKSTVGVIYQLKNERAKAVNS